MSYQGPPPSGPPDPWAHQPGQPTSGQPMSGQPMSGQPMSGQPYHDPARYGAYPPPPPAGPYGAPGTPGYGYYPPTLDERNWGMLAHLGGIIAAFLFGLAFIGPLVVYLVKKDESRFIRHHAADALNLTLTGLIVLTAGSIIGCVLSIIGIGLLLLLLLIPYGILLLVYLIIASVAASRGEWYSYPAWLRFPMVS